MGTRAIATIDEDDEHKGMSSQKYTAIKEKHLSFPDTLRAEINMNGVYYYKIEGGPKGNSQPIPVTYNTLKTWKKFYRIIYVDIYPSTTEQYIQVYLEEVASLELSGAQLIVLGTYKQCYTLTYLVNTESVYLLHDNFKRCYEKITHLAKKVDMPIQSFRIIKKKAATLSDIELMLRGFEHTRIDYKDLGIAKFVKCISYSRKVQKHVATTSYLKVRTYLDQQDADLSIFHILYQFKKAANNNNLSWLLRNIYMTNNCGQIYSLAVGGIFHKNSLNLFIFRLVPVAVHRFKAVIAFMVSARPEKSRVIEFFQTEVLRHYPADLSLMSDHLKPLIAPHNVGQLFFDTLRNVIRNSGSYEGSAIFC